MGKMKEFDRKACDILRKEIDAAVAEIAQRHGIALKTGRASFSSETITFKLEAGLVNEDGRAVTKEATDYRALALSLNMDPNMVGRQIEWRGDVWVFEGYRLRARVRPFIMKKKSDGKAYVFDEKTFRLIWQLGSRTDAIMRGSTADA